MREEGQAGSVAVDAETAHRFVHRKIREILTDVRSAASPDTVRCDRP
jgi:hypothetical protein